MRSVVLASMVVACSLAACSTDSKRDSAGIKAASTTSGIATNASSSTAGASPSKDVPASASVPPERSVYYDFENSLIHEADLPILQKNARFLISHPDAKVTIEGNCDERGTNEYNVALGERRALEAKKLLESYGVSEKQITVISYGKERPRATCHAETCWKENRRSDLDYGTSG